MIVNHGSCDLAQFWCESTWNVLIENMDKGRSYGDVITKFSRLDGFNSIQFNFIIIIIIIIM